VNPKNPPNKTIPNPKSESWQDRNTILKPVSQPKSNYSEKLETLKIKIQESKPK